MKLLIQSDDYGITKAVSCGIIEGIKNGVFRCTGLFVNMPSSEDAAKMIADYPEVCLGIDINLVAGKPVSDPAKVPSLIKENGYFYDSRERRKRDQECESHDHMDEAETYLEAKAQIERFIALTGKKPEYLHGHAYGSPTITKVHERLSAEYGIPMTQKILADHHVKMAKSWYTVPFSLEQQLSLSTKDFLLADRGEILGSEMAAIISHCGYVDAPLFEVSSFTMIRAKDLEAMVSDEMKAWIKENHIELITYRDLQAD